MNDTIQGVARKLEKGFFPLLGFIPLSIWFALFTENRTATFITSILAILPLARIIGRSTREIALQTNPAIGGLVNATFGNAIELFICVLALNAGLTVVVKASIVGSIIGNILLLTGVSIFAGGLRFKEQTFNKDSVGVSSTMLIIAVTGLAIPTVYSMTAKADPRQVQILSDALAIVMATVYFAGLIFAFFTHKHLFDASDEILAADEKPSMSRETATILLLGAMLAVAIESHFLVRDVEAAARSLGVTQTFIGVVVIAIITNISEKVSAVRFALENKLDLSLEIGLSSAIQIALFVVPTLVLVSEIFGLQFSIQFSMFEIVSILLAVMIVNHLSSDGRCNWLEGVQLVSVYLIIAIAFFFL
jgi:Ca2+:H+ antiporter